MGLYKRGSTWWMRLTHQGRRIRKSTEVFDKKTAEKIYYKAKTLLAEGKWFESMPGDNKTLKELTEKYLIEHSLINKAPGSYKRDKSLTCNLLRLLGDPILTEITPALVSQYKNKRRQEEAAPATVNKELKLLGHAFNLALKEWEWVKDNPVSKVSKEKNERMVERWLTLEEEKSLLAHSPAWLQELIIFSINTGLRQSELLNLKWGQVDLFRKTMTFLSSEQKNKNSDTLPFNEAALAILKTKVRRIDTPFVFVSENSTRIDSRNLRRSFYTACKKAKIEDLRWHDLRHTFATRLVQAGVDLYAVKKLGRWKSLSMVMRYGHHHSESLRAGVEILDKVNSNFGTKLAQSDNEGVSHGG